MALRGYFLQVNFEVILDNEKASLGTLKGYF